MSCPATGLDLREIINRLSSIVDFNSAVNLLNECRVFDLGHDSFDGQPNHQRQLVGQEFERDGDRFYVLWCNEHFDVFAPTHHFG